MDERKFGFKEGEGINFGQLADQNPTIDKLTAPEFAALVTRMGNEAAAEKQATGKIIPIDGKPAVGADDEKEFEKAA